MKYVDFRKFTDDNGAMPIYLFEGEEVYFSSKGEAFLQSRFVSQPLLDYTSFDGTALKGEKLSALTDAVNSFPFMSEKRLVRVTELYPTEKEFEAYLQPLFDNPPSSSILLIINSGKAKTGTLPLAKQKNVTFVDCGKADEETIKKWIYLTAKKAGVYADGVTCGLLAAYCNYDMSRVSMETEKLLQYCEAVGAQRMTDEIVQENVAPEAEYKIYELTNAVSRKNYADFVTILQDFLQKNVEIISLLSMLGSYFKTLYEVKLMRGTDGSIAAELGLKEFAVKKNREQASKFTKEELFVCYDAIFQSVSAIKCGELTPNAALKQVTARIFLGNS